MNAANTSANAREFDRTIRAYSRRFHNVYLYITERCQLRCGHCYMGDRLERGLKMSSKQALDIIGYMYRMGAEYLTFVGGEPTLHPDLPQFAEYASQIGYRKIMVDTNGLLVDRLKLIRPELLYYVRVSLDGASAATHDKVRGRGSFEKTTSAIQTLVAWGYSVRITSTVFHFNVHEAPAMLALADQLGVQLVNFHTFSEEGYGVSNAHWSLQPDDWFAFCESLRQLKGQYRTAVRYPPTWATPERVKEYAEQGFRGCLGCSLDRLSIFPDGRCYVCSVLFDKPYHFATLGAGGLNLNTGDNEYDLFARARVSTAQPSLMGCPAEAALEQQGRQRADPSLVSMCRLWRAEL